MVVSPAGFPAAHDRRHPGSRFVVGPREQLVMRHSADLAKQVRIADQLEPDIDVTTPIRGRPGRCAANRAMIASRAAVDVSASMCSAATPFDLKSWTTFIDSAIDTAKTIARLPGVNFR